MNRKDHTLILPYHLLKVNEKCSENGKFSAENRVTDEKSSQLPYLTNGLTMRFLQVTYHWCFISEGNHIQIMAVGNNDYDLYSAHYQAIWLNTDMGTLRLLKRQVTLWSADAEAQSEKTPIFSAQK